MSDTLAIAVAAITAFWSSAPWFRDTPRLERQRTVKGLLQDLFSDGLIHALSIKALTPEEYFN